MTSLIEWGVRWPGEPQVSTYGPPGAATSEKYAKRVAAARPEATLVHRTVTYSAWSAAEPDVCPHGHPRTKQSMYVSPTGQRACRACRNAASRRSKAKRRTQRERAA